MIRWLKRSSSPPPPPWVEPRRISEKGDPDDYTALKQRLDTAWRDGRDVICKDRETGLYWYGVTMDYGPIGAANEHLRPLGLSPPENVPLRESFDEDYVERYISRFGTWRFDDWYFKVYSISVGDRGVSEDEYYFAAHKVVEELLPAASDTPHFGNGFVIVHYGLEGVWLLVNWWVEGGICAGRLLKALLDSPVFERVEGPLIACVWELVPIDFERRAWVDIVLKRTGSLSVYQQSFLSPAYY